MGSYTDPAIQKSYTNPVSSKSFSGPSIGERINLQRERAIAAKANQDANWKIYKEQKLLGAEQQMAIENAILGSPTGKNGTKGKTELKGGKGVIDRSSLESAVGTMVGKITNAKISLQTNTGWYPEMEEHLAVVNNSTKDIANIGDQFQNFHVLMDKFASSNMTNNQGDISPTALNPHMNLLKQIGDNNSGVSGEVGYKSTYSKEHGTQWQVVIKGESVAALNKKLFKESGGDEKFAKGEYVFELENMSNIMNDSDGNPYTNGGEFIETPNINSEQERSDIVDQGILKKDGAATEDFMNKVTIEKNGTIYDQESPDINKVDEALITNTEVFAGEISSDTKVLQTWVNALGHTDGTNVRIENDEDGVPQYIYKALKRNKQTNRIELDGEGNPQFEKEVPIGDGGFYENEYSDENATRYDFNKEDWKNIKNLVADQFLLQNKLNRKGSLVKNEALTKQLVKSKVPKEQTAAQRKQANVRSQIIKARDEIIRLGKEEGTEAQIKRAYKALNNLGGNTLYMEQSPDDSKVFNIMNQNAGEKSTILQEYQDIEDPSALVSLLNAYGVAPSSQEIAKAQASQGSDRAAKLQTTATAIRKKEKEVESITTKLKASSGVLLKDFPKTADKFLEMINNKDNRKAFSTSRLKVVKEKGGGFLGYLDSGKIVVSVEGKDPVKLDPESPNFAVEWTRVVNKLLGE